MVSSHEVPLKAVSHVILVFLCKQKVLKIRDHLVYSSLPLLGSPYSKPLLSINYVPGISVDKEHMV